MKDKFSWKKVDLKLLWNVEIRLGEIVMVVVCVCYWNGVCDKVLFLGLFILDELFYFD